MHTKKRPPVTGWCARCSPSHSYLASRLTSQRLFLPRSSRLCGARSSLCSGLAGTCQPHLLPASRHTVCWPCPRDSVLSSLLIPFLTLKTELQADIPAGMCHSQLQPSSLVMAAPFPALKITAVPTPYHVSRSYSLHFKGNKRRLREVIFSKSHS